MASLKIVRVQLKEDYQGFKAGQEVVINYSSLNREFHDVIESSDVDKRNKEHGFDTDYGVVKKAKKVEEPREEKVEKVEEKTSASEASQASQSFGSSYSGQLESASNFTKKTKGRGRPSKS